MTFCFFGRIIFLLFLFPGERRKYISSLCGFSGEISQNVFIVSPWENSHWERFHSERKKTYLFIFNSGSLWVVLKLPKTTPLFSLINWVGSSQPTWTPKLNSNISYLHKMGWTSSITHPSSFYSTFEGH